jgi:hypothetical protein
MIRGGARDLVQLKIAAFESRDYTRLLDLYVTPLPIYADGEVLTYHSREELARSLATLRAHYDTLGVRAFCGEVVAESLCRESAFQVYVDWHYAFDPPEPPRTSGIVYYCRRPYGAGTPEMEVAMVEYRRAAFSLAPLTDDARRMTARAAALGARRT